MRPKEKFAITEPAKCTGMSKEEMEYDGGFWNFVTSVALTAVGIGCDIMAEKTGKSSWKLASNACTGAGIALSFGTMGISAFAARSASRVLSRKATKILTGMNYNERSQSVLRNQIDVNHGLTVFSALLNTPDYVKRIVTR